MALYKKCAVCGSVWIVGQMQARSSRKYECPDCERKRNERDRADNRQRMKDMEEKNAAH